MIYLLNEGEIPEVPWEEAAKLKGVERNVFLAQYKSKDVLFRWCTGPSKGLKDFCQEICNLDYASKPNYSKLKNMLRSLISGNEPQVDKYTEQLKLLTIVEKMDKFDSDRSTQKSTPLASPK